MPSGVFGTGPGGQQVSETSSLTLMAALWLGQLQGLPSGTFGYSVDGQHVDNTSSITLIFALILGELQK